MNWLIRPSAPSALLPAGTPRGGQAPHGAARAGSWLQVPEAGATWLSCARKGRKWLDTWDVMTELDLNTI